MHNKDGRLYIHGPAKLTEKTHEIWSKSRKFECQFCGHQFVVGDTFAALYTNYKGQRSGNPIICEKCIKIDTKILLFQWKLMGNDQFIRDEAKKAAEDLKEFL